MKTPILTVILATFFFGAAVTSAQNRKAANPAAAPPSVLRWVSQEAPSPRNTEKDRIQTAMSRASDRLEAPSTWIDLHALSGSPETVLFEPFDSYEHWEQSLADWNNFCIQHPDVARLQDDFDRVSGSERKTFALRRDDVGYLADTIDLSEMHYMRVLEVRLFAGHEDEFIESLGVLSDGYKKVQADTPWVVYQVDMGTANPTFLVIFPLATLAQNDNFLAMQRALLDAQGGEAVEHAKQVARESYASAQSTLYAVRPGLSHVPKEFAEGDPDFWRPASAPGSRPSSRSNEATPKN
jgi:hypothetical protein